jgi:hypothetical protein
MREQESKRLALFTVYPRIAVHGHSDSHVRHRLIKEPMAMLVPMQNSSSAA